MRSSGRLIQLCSPSRCRSMLEYLDKKKSGRDGGEGARSLDRLTTTSSCPVYKTTAPVPGGHDTGITKGLAVSWGYRTSIEQISTESPGEGERRDQGFLAETKIEAGTGMAMAGPDPCGTMRRRTVSRGRDAIISIHSYLVKLLSRVLPLHLLTLGHCDHMVCTFSSPSASISYHFFPAFGVRCVIAYLNPY